MVPLPTQVLQSEGVIRDVLSQPVEDKFSSVADIAHRNINDSSSKSINSYASNNENTDYTTQSFSPVPAITGISGSSRVIVSALASATVEQDVPKSV